MTHPVLSMQRNSNFRAVREVQALLNGLGYRAQVNGHFSLDTRNAVRSLQADRGLEPTGVVDGATWVELHGTTPVELPNDDHGGAGLRHDHVDADGVEDKPGKKRFRRT